MNSILKIIPSKAEMIDYINSCAEIINNLGFSDDIDFCDHICLRVASAGESDPYRNYIEIRNYLLANSFELIAENIFPMTEKGRPIANFFMPLTLETQLGTVRIFELPAPRLGRKEVEGIDHIEVVLNKAKSLTAFINEHEYVLITEGNVSKSELAQVIQQEQNGEINPDVTINIDNKRIKFHIKSLDLVITQEQSKEEFAKKFNDLENSFKHNYPNVMLQS